MKFDRYIPAEPLRPYIRYIVLSENEQESAYKVFPSAGLVAGFQYRGQLSVMREQTENKLNTAGITGLTDSYRLFKNSANIGTVLVCFTETGFTHFTSHPANELFNQSVSLDEVLDKRLVSEVEEKLSSVSSDQGRVRVVERFLIALLNSSTDADGLIAEAVRLIYQSQGTIRMGELCKQLFISQSNFEKRFRKIVGTSPKKFASIVRFNAVWNELNTGKSLADICYDNGFFDQAHFIKDFKQYTGDSPEKFRRFV